MRWVIVDLKFKRNGERKQYVYFTWTPLGSRLGLSSKRGKENQVESEIFIKILIQLTTTRSTTSGLRPRVVIALYEWEF